MAKKKEQSQEAALSVEFLLFPVVESFFKDDDWPYTVTEANKVMQTRFNGENGQWPCYAFCKEEQQQFSFYSICPIKVPEAQRNSMAEYLTRANYGLTLGNFEMDYTDGEIRYKTSIDVEHDRLSTALCKHIVYCNVMMMDRYLPGIIAVLGGKTPHEAIQMIETE